MKKLFTSARTMTAIVVVLSLVIISTASASHVFDDVADNRFFAEAVEWAADNGITTGTGPSTFEPDRGVTRGETVTFLKRYNDNVVVPALDSVAQPLLFTSTSTAGLSTDSTAFLPILDTTLDVVVPPGGSWRALITFSAESVCTQDPAVTVFCLVQAVVDPGGAIASPGAIVFDSVQHGANSTDTLGRGSHSAQWTSVLTPGTHTIEIQYRVDEADAEFVVFSRMLSVQLYPV